ncbi:conserved hypothetical protein [Trichinella spiralis]|uniref:hypothetical protein n=1 Tax=Trichinella spiralis TaxID=6334 RepID=UPI0001EFB6D2|nr:conserved hypothetical protein [Trichinella spiralis]
MYREFDCERICRLFTLKIVFNFVYAFGHNLNREAWEEILRRNNLNPIALRDQRYNQIVHLVSGTVCGRGDTAYGRDVSAAVGAENFYHCSTALRLESLEEAREVEHRTRHVWVGHPYMDIIDNENCKTFRDKMLKMAQVICDRAGVEYGDRLAPNSIKRKFLVSNFDLSQCKDYQEFDVVHECVRSDMGQTWIRRRGQNGNWLYTINERRVVDGVPVETKALLSRREYEMLRAHVDPATYPTFKKRLCFVHAHHYYQLDNPVLRGWLVIGRFWKILPSTSRDMSRFENFGDLHDQHDWKFTDTNFYYSIERSHQGYSVFALQLVQKGRCHLNERCCVIFQKNFFPSECCYVLLVCFIDDECCCD